MFEKIRNYRLPAGAALAIMSGAAAAQTAAPDTSSVVTTITGALASIAAIGAAWVGFKYLKKVWNKL